jgi:hypothetical protein
VKKHVRVYFFLTINLILFFVIDNKHYTSIVIIFGYEGLTGQMILKVKLSVSLVGRVDLLELKPDSERLECRAKILYFLRA